MNIIFDKDNTAMENETSSDSGVIRSKTLSKIKKTDLNASYIS